jgi:hypothetical protein
MKLGSWNEETKVLIMMKKYWDHLIIVYLGLLLIKIS